MGDEDSVVAALARLAHSQDSYSYECEDLQGESLGLRIPNPFRETPTDVLEAIKGAARTT